MKVFIAGGAGFIGSHLTARHLAQGDSVVVLDNLITGTTENLKSLSANPALQFIEGDVTAYDLSGFTDLDIIYHLASPASPIQYKKHAVETLLANSRGTFFLLEMLRNNPKSSFVMASTSEIYGDPLVHPQKEDYWGNVNTVGPRSCYDEGKRFAEAMCYTYWKKYDLNIRIARIFNTYGPNMEKNDGRVVSNFITQAIDGAAITIYGDGSQTRSFCYVADMVEGLRKLATVPGIAGEVINLGNPTEKTMNELAEIIKNMVQSQSEIVHREIDADDPKKRKPDIGKAKQILGWEPKVSLEDGLRETIEYFKQRFS